MLETKILIRKMTKNSTNIMTTVTYPGYKQSTVTYRDGKIILVCLA